MKQNDNDMMLYEIALFIGIVFSIVFVIMFFTIDNKNKYERIEEIIISNNSASKNVVYIQVPYVYYEEELAIEADRRAVEDYMSKLTEENAEEWWYGYRIMMDGKDSPPEQITDVYSMHDLSYLYRCVETEVYGGDFLSKAHVAMVIFNRLDEGCWGNSIAEIITRPNQFSYSRANVSQQTIQACAFAFEMKDMTQGATAFHSGSKSNTFWGKQYLFTDSVGHHFYK